MAANIDPVFPKTPRFGSATLTLPELRTDAPSTNVGTIITGVADGTRIDQIEIVGLGSIKATKLRLFLYDGSTYHLKKEIVISSDVTQSATVSPYSSVLSAAYNPDILPLHLPSASHSLRATITEPQVLNNPVQAGVCASQNISGAGYALLNGLVYGTGGSGIAASTTAISALQTTAGAAYLTMTSYPYVLSTPAQIAITSGSASQTGVNFTVDGLDAAGVAQTETIAGGGASTTVYTTKVYSVVHQVWASGAVASTGVSLGYSSVAVFPYGTTSKVTITSTANLSGVTFTIRGIDKNNVNQNENLTGPTAGAVVTSVNEYKLITSIYASGAANPTIAGAPAILGKGIKVNCYGGDMTA